MKIFAKAKYIRIAPSKIDKLLKKIRGKKYGQALSILKGFPQKTGSIVWQTLYSAASNASHNFSLAKEDLIISEAYVNQASILKRMRPRARGRAFRIEKKMSHLTIFVKKKITIS